jgi:hypothetical protein
MFEFRRIPIWNAFIQSHPRLPDFPFRMITHEIGKSPTIPTQIDPKIVLLGHLTLQEILKVSSCNDALRESRLSTLFCKDEAMVNESD